MSLGGIPPRPFAPLMSIVSAAAALCWCALLALVVALLGLLVALLVLQVRWVPQADGGRKQQQEPVSSVAEAGQEGATPTNRSRHHSRGLSERFAALPCQSQLPRSGGPRWRSMQINAMFKEAAASGTKEGGITIPCPCCPSWTFWKIFRSCSLRT